jgi:hypothetical protein
MMFGSWSAGGESVDDGRLIVDESLELRRDAAPPAHLLIEADDPHQLGIGTLRAPLNLRNPGVPSSARWLETV